MRIAIISYTGMIEKLKPIYIAIKLTHIALYMDYSYLYIVIPYMVYS